MTRKIKIYSTLGQSGEIETNISTLGELKPLLDQRGINYLGMKMLVGETRNELSVSDASLPSTDFKLFLMPKKTKSGGNRLSELFQNLAEICEEIAEEVSEATVYDNGPKEVSTTPVRSVEDELAFEELRKLAQETNGEW